MQAHVRSRARAIGLDTHGTQRDEERVGIDTLSGDAHAMVCGKARRGPTRILRVVSRPALLRVAHAGKAAEEAAARGTDAAERCKGGGDGGRDGGGASKIGLRPVLEFLRELTTHNKILRAVIKEALRMFI